MATTTDPDRSRVMRAVKATDTGPEMAVRRMLHKLGYRYRLHGKDLPGKPDLVFASRKAVIFIHGCFWHGHDCSRGARTPKTNAKYWTEKIHKNTNRDTQVLKDLKELGWRLLVVWECELKDMKQLQNKIVNFLTLHA